MHAWPEVGSYRRSSMATSVLFPEPLRPTCTSGCHQALLLGLHCSTGLVHTLLA